MGCHSRKKNINRQKAAGRLRAEGTRTVLMRGVMQTRAKPSILLHFPILHTLQCGLSVREIQVQTLFPWLLISTPYV